MANKIKGGTKRQPIYSGPYGRVAKAIDAAVGLVLPRIAHEWRKSRVKSAALVAYESARISRYNPKTDSASADGEILPSIRELRDLSRTMIRDDAHAATTINIHEECIVGEGIRPQSACRPESTGMSESQCEVWRKACNEEWERWCDEEADATRVGTFYDLQVLALRCELQDGDGIGHAVVGGEMIACELIDADRVESPGFIDTDLIRGGVELGAHGERVAFHILPSHPDDHFPGTKWTTQPDRIRVTDDNGTSIVQHVYKRTRPGQTRGVPLLTPSLLYTRHLHHYLDSELIAARSASNFAMFIKRNVSQTDADIFPVQDDEQASGVQYHEFLEPGIIEYLNEGEEPVPFNPNRPGEQFEPFVVRVLRAICASSGLSYEVVCRDFGRMNLSSARAMLREIRRGFDLRRRRFVRGFCQPWWNNVIRHAVGAGRLKPPGRDWLDRQRAFLAATWVAPAYGMVDPETDVKGSMMSVDANLSDQYQEAARHGLDAEHVLRERARFYRRAKDLEAEFGLAPGTLTMERPQRSQSVEPSTTGAGNGATSPDSGTGAPAPAGDSTDDDAEGDDVVEQKRKRKGARK